VLFLINDDRFRRHDATGSWLRMRDGGRLQAEALFGYVQASTIGPTKALQISALKMLSGSTAVATSLGCG
jgi:hypothetical protein